MNYNLHFRIPTQNLCVCVCVCVCVCFSVGLGWMGMQLMSLDMIPVYS